ncbi:hypothetical protein P9847_20825 [Paenibacillus chibensis]|uniref:BIG2 domain-containing protein n=1 Tax=Paenibacillus chibensis TaxID=59846 RepID=A0ABU6PXX4_9BACL|nr:hypothetical protein [Paenibacillus chibensis]
MSTLRSRFLPLILAVMTALALQGGIVHGESSDEPAIAWSQDYGNWSAGEGVMPTSDGGYLALGSLTEQEMSGDWETYSQKAYMVKLDAEGAVQWEQKLTHDGSETNAASQAIETRDGGYFIIGTSTSTSGQPYSQLLMVRLDASGRILWEQTKEEEGIHSMPQTAIETADGDFIIGGKGISNMGYSSANLLKVDGDGQELWYKKYRFGGNSQYFNDLIPAVDGGYIAVGGIDSPDYEPGDRDALLIVKVGEDGEQAWMKETVDPETDWGAFGVVATDDGGYLIGSQKVINQQRITVLTETDTSGEPKWEKTYPAGADIEVFNRIVKTADGYALLGGNASGDYKNRKVQYDLMTVSQSGELLDRTLFKGAPISRYGKGSAAPDGGYIFPGTVKREDKTKFQLMKVAPSAHQPSAERTLTGIAFTEKAKTLKSGIGAPTVLQAVYGDGTSEDLSSSAAYRSDDPKIAAVDTAGRITATAPGETVIHAEYRDFSAELKVSVLSADDAAFDPVSGAIQMDSDEYSLAAGSSIDIHLLFMDAATGKTTDVTAKASFRSDHPDIAGVDDEGNLTGYRAGVTRIYGSYKGKSVFADVQVLRSSAVNAKATPAGSPVWQSQTKK